MYRYLVGAIVAALIAALLGWRWYKQEQVERQRGQAQISELSARISQLEAQNNQLNAELAKVQAEEQRQVTENDLLAKVLAQAKLTGKIPDKLPYPPK
jgi:predicted negative regulator of RcsB-dependent stress response